MKIRQERTEDYAVREDIPEIAAFIDSAWRSAYRGILSPEYLDSLSADERRAAFVERFDSGHSRFLVMRDDNGIVGAAVFGRSITEGYPDDGEVSALYLRQDCRGKGHGHALFSKAERELAGMGYTDFVLDVFTANTRAIAFYTAHGYKKVDERLLNLRGIDYPYTVFRKHYEVVAFGLTLTQNEMERKNIHVVGAIILRDQKALATQRGYGDYAGWWEFPGGKIEDGETPEAALVREIKEELKADITIDRYFDATEYDYPKFHLSMKCYLCTLTSPTIDLTEHMAAEWFDRTDVYNRKWLNADIPILDKLLEEGIL